MGICFGTEEGTGTRAMTLCSCHICGCYISLTVVGCTVSVFYRTAVVYVQQTNTNPGYYQAYPAPQPFVQQSYQPVTPVIVAPQPYQAPNPYYSYPVNPTTPQYQPQVVTQIYSSPAVYLPSPAIPGV
jgi:hypothetical protein